jgi:MFS family permease
MTVHAPLLEDVAPQTQEVVAQASPQPWPRPADAWRTLWILSLVLGLSQIDRGILSMLIKDIKHDVTGLGGRPLTDGQVGILLGFAFSSLYLFLSFPLSRLTDSKSRRVMIAAGVAVWSVSTALCGLAQGFWQMFAARAGVGAGESVNGPATYSLLADSFPRDKLPRAMSILNVGFMFGTAFSLIGGGLVIGALAHAHASLPFIGPLKTWQLVFMAVGLPGLLVSALMMTIKEPVRRGLGGRPATGQAAPLSELGNFIFRNRRYYGCMQLSVFIDGVILYGAQNWRVEFFRRTYNWTSQHTGLVVGTATAIATLVAIVAAPWVAEQLNRRRADGSMLAAFIAKVVALPLMVAAPLAPNPWVAVVLTATATGVALIGTPAMVAAMQTVTPNNVRAQVNSLGLVLFSGITGFIGPWFIGALTDMLHDPNKLRYVLALAPAVGSPIALAIFWFSIKPFGQMIEDIKAQEAAAGAAE